MRIKSVLRGSHLSHGSSYDRSCDLDAPPHGNGRDREIESQSESDDERTEIPRSRSLFGGSRRGGAGGSGRSVGAESFRRSATPVDRSASTDSGADGGGSVRGVGTQVGAALRRVRSLSPTRRRRTARPTVVPAARAEEGRSPILGGAYNRGFVQRDHSHAVQSDLLSKQLAHLRQQKLGKKNSGMSLDSIHESVSSIGGGPFPAPDDAYSPLPEIRERFSFESSGGAGSVEGASAAYLPPPMRQLHKKHSGSFESLHSFPNPSFPGFPSGTMNSPFQASFVTSDGGYSDLDVSLSGCGSGLSALSNQSSLYLNEYHPLFPPRPPVQLLNKHNRVRSVIPAVPAAAAVATGEGDRFAVPAPTAPAAPEQEEDSFVVSHDISSDESEDADVEWGAGGHARTGGDGGGADRGADAPRPPAAVQWRHATVERGGTLDSDDAPETTWGRAEQCRRWASFPSDSLEHLRPQGTAPGTARTERHTGARNSEKRVAHLRRFFCENVADWRVTADERTEAAAPEHDYALIRQKLFEWNVDAVLPTNLAGAPRWIRDMVVAAGTGGWVGDGEVYDFELLKKFFCEHVDAAALQGGADWSHNKDAGRETRTVDYETASRSQGATCDNDTDAGREAEPADYSVDGAQGEAWDNDADARRETGTTDDEQYVPPAIPAATCDTDADADREPGPAHDEAPPAPPSDTPAAPSSKKYGALLEPNLARMSREDVGAKLAHRGRMRPFPAHGRHYVQRHARH